MFWSNLGSWCKERWELLTGFVVGILAVIVALKSGSTKSVLEEKNKTQKKIDDAKSDANKKLEDAFGKNIQKFLNKDEEIDKKLREDLSSLDEDKKDRVRQLVESNSPEQEIADALKEILK